MVRLSLSTLLALLSASNLAASDSAPKRQSLSLSHMKRQSGAFIPDTTNGSGETCADAYGPGYVSCGSGIDCVNPAEGQTCCSGGYGCPENSFCLTEGYCCPDGLSPASCALSHSVTLPADFTMAAASDSDSTAPSTSTSTSASTSTGTSSSVSPRTSISTSPSLSTSTGSTVTPVPTSSHTTSTVAAGSAPTSTTQTTATQTTTTQTPSPQATTTARPSTSTGAARAWRPIGAGEGSVGVWGLVGLVGMLSAAGGVL